MSCRTKAGCGTLFGLVIRNKNEEENDELDRIVYRGSFRGGLTFCLGKTKGAQGTELYLWIGGFVLATVLSMGLLAKAVQTLPIGTAYAIWTGVGALGTVLLGIFVFGESGGVSPGFFLSLPCSVLSSD